MKRLNGKEIGTWNSMYTIWMQFFSFVFLAVYAILVTQIEKRDDFFQSQLAWLA